MTSEEQTQKQIDAVVEVLDAAIDKVIAFYDCRLVLGVLLGQASMLAAGLRQTRVLDPRSLTQYFMAALEGAFVDGKMPKVVALGETNGGTKQ
jgi:hypothetical protein